MSIDFSKLTPAPWTVSQCVLEIGELATTVPGPGENNSANAEFCALARNALDVMMRRGWGVVQYPDGWGAAIPSMEELSIIRSERYSDPFSALVESDKWYRLNVEQMT